MKPVRMIKRVLVVSTFFAAVFLALFPLVCDPASYAQAADPPAKPAKKVAILKLGSHVLIDEVETAVFRGLKDHYGDGVKIAVYNGNFEQDLLRQSVNQIISSDFDVAVPITTPASSALISVAPKNLQVIFSFVSSPDSLWGGKDQRPPNVTGTSDQINYEGNLRLIALLFPQATRIGYLANEAEAQSKLGLEEVKRIAPRFGMTIVTGAVASPSDVATAARSIADKVDVFLVGGDNTVVSGLGGLLSSADRNNKPVFAVERTSVEKGCLAAYGVDYTALGKKTAELVVKVLEGAAPSGLEVVYFRDTNLYVNRAALQKFGLSMPKDVFMIY